MDGPVLHRLGSRLTWPPGRLEFLQTVVRTQDVENHDRRHPPIIRCRLFDGLDATALKFAAAARARVQDFYLTVSTDKAGAVIPLSPALADGTALVLHRVVSVEPYTAPSPSPHQHNNGNSSAPAATGLMLPLLPEGATRERRVVGGARGCCHQSLLLVWLVWKPEEPIVWNRGATRAARGPRTAEPSNDRLGKRTYLARLVPDLPRGHSNLLHLHLSLTATEAAWRGVITRDRDWHGDPRRRDGRHRGVALL